MIPSMLSLSSPNQRAFGRKIHQAARGRRWRCPGDGAVFTGTKPAFESFRAFAQHAQECLLLPLIELTFQPVHQLCLVDQEFNQRDRTMLCLDSDSRKRRQPSRDLIFLIRDFERFVVTLAPGEDRGRQCHRRRPPQAFC